MELGSHNSFSYLPSKKWWMKPFGWMARCQEVDIWDQWYWGSHLFDLRIRFTKTGIPTICHGLMEFEHADDFVISIIEHINVVSQGNIYMRVVLETNKHDELQESYFKQFCANLESSFPKIHFFGGNNRQDWGCKNPVYKFKNPLEDLDDKYSSVTTLFPDGPKWLRWIDDLYPKFYAKRHNHENIQAGTTHKWLFIDFVNIQ